MVWRSDSDKGKYEIIFETESSGLDLISNILSWILEGM